MLRSPSWSASCSWPGSVVVVVRQCRLWAVRHEAVTRSDRVRTRCAPAHAACAASTAALGLLVIVSAVTGGGATPVRVLIATTAVAVVGPPSCTYGVEAEKSVRPFTILTGSEPTSPWRTVPFHPPVAVEPASAPNDGG